MKMRARQHGGARGGRRRQQAGRVAAVAEPLEARTLLSAVLSWISGPAHLTVAPDSSVWYATGSTLTRRASDGTLSTFTVTGAGGGTRAVASDLAFTADSSAWFVATDSAGRHLERVSPQGAVTHVSSTLGNVWDVTVAGDGRVWFASGQNVLGVMDADGSAASVHTRTVAGLTAFSDITTGPDGNVWFAGNRATGGMIGTADWSGAVRTYPIAARPSDIVAANDALYAGGNDGMVRITTDGAMTALPVPGTTSLELTPGRNGDVWFIDYRSARNPIARLQAGGGVTHYAVPGQTGAKITSLAVADDGRVLYTGVTSAGSPLVGAIGGATNVLARAAELYPVANTAFTGVVASFEDPLGLQAGVFAATIQWGDGGVSAGTVARNAQGVYEVVGAHTYTSAGWKAITVRLTEAGGVGRAMDVLSAAYVVAVSSGSVATVTDNAVAITSGADFNYNGATVSGVVGGFVDLQTNGTVGEQVFYEAVINWGNGARTTGTVVPLSGSYKVVANFTYEQGGNYPISLSVRRYTFSGPGIVAQVPTDFAFYGGTLLSPAQLTGNAAYVVTRSEAGYSSQVMVLSSTNAWTSTSVYLSLEKGLDSFQGETMARPVGHVYIGAPGEGSPGGVEEPGTPNPPTPRPVVVVPAAQAGSAEAAGGGTGNVSDVRIGGTTVRVGGTAGPARLADTGYTLLPPDRSGQDPGAFRGELAVGVREWVDEAPEEAGDGTASYASDSPEGPVRALPARQAAVAAPAPLPPLRQAVTPAVAEEAAEVMIATAVRVKASEVLAEEERARKQDVPEVGTPLEVKTLAVAEAPVAAMGVMRWWKAAAVLGAGAIVQAWYWRRVYKARHRWM